MNIGTRYKVTKNAWFLYATKDIYNDCFEEVEREEP